MALARQLEDRNKSFMSSKASRTEQEYFAMRDSFAVELRKKKRNDQAMFKRKKLTSTPISIPPNPQDVLLNLSISNLASLKALRQYLCSPHIDFELICKLAPHIVSDLALGLSEKEETVLESCWCLTNLALGPPGLVNDISELIPQVCGFILVVSSKIIAEQCCWLLGNLAAESLRLRDKIKQVCGLLKAICNLFRFNNPSLSSVACWTLCNLIRSQSPDSSIFVEAGAVGPVLEHIHRPESTELCTDSLWFLSYLTVNTGAGVVISVLTDRHMQRLIALFSSTREPAIQVPILRIWGNLITYGSSPASFIRFLPVRDLVLDSALSDVMEVQREAFWLLANAFGVSANYTEWFVTSSKALDVVRAMCRSMDAESENDLKNEGCIALYNLSESSSSAYIQTVLDIGGIPLLDACLKNLVDMPFWFSLQVQGVSDIDRLLSSVGIIHLTLEHAAARKSHPDPEKLPQPLLFKLSDRDTFEVLEGFALQYAGKESRIGTPEAFLKDLCADILRRFYSEFTPESVYS